jgi:ribosome-associated translation inhibitor RaiA
MKTEVRFTGIDASDALHAYVVRRVHFRLSRFDGEVGSVVVRIADVNGPRGGADKRCHVLVRGRGRVTVEELSADAYSAVDLALERAARAVSRGLERGRGVRRSESAAGRTS